MTSTGEIGAIRNTERKQNNTPDRPVVVAAGVQPVVPVVTLTSPVRVTVVNGQLTTVRQPLAA